MDEVKKARLVAHHLEREWRMAYESEILDSRETSGGSEGNSFIDMMRVRAGLTPLA